MTRLRISRDARRDLQDIRTYSKASFGVAIARGYLDGLFDVFGHLRERPLMGAAREDLGPDVRAFGYRSHRIYYAATVGSVDILRILHHARDAGAAFPISR